MDSQAHGSSSAAERREGGKATIERWEGQGLVTAGADTGEIWGGGGVESGRTEVDVRPTGTVATDSCELPYGGWGLNPGPLEEQAAMLPTFEPSASHAANF